MRARTILLPSAVRVSIERTLGRGPNVDQRGLSEAVLHSHILLLKPLCSVCYIQIISYRWGESLMKWQQLATA